MQLLLTALLALSPITGVSSVQAAEDPTVCVSCQAGANEIETREGLSRWYYKNIGGICFKRLYNCSKGEWVGGWIPCGNIFG